MSHLQPDGRGERHLRRSQSYRLHKQIGPILRVANQNAVDVFNQFMLEEFGSERVTTTQFAVLSTLWQYGPLTHSQIAYKTAMDLPTLNSVVGRLTDKALVVSESDPGDRRRRIVTLTPSGEKLGRRLRSVGTEISDRILSPLTGEEQEQLLSLLSKFNAARRSIPSE